MVASAATVSTLLLQPLADGKGKRRGGRDQPAWCLVLRCTGSYGECVREVSRLLACAHGQAGGITRIRWRVI